MSQVRDWKIAGFIGLAVVALMGCFLIDGLRPVRYDDSLVSTLNIDDSDLRINWNRYPDFTVELTETLTIRKSGIYNIYGELTDGMIIVDVGDEVGKAKLVLHDVKINNNSGPAIYVKSADDVVIESAAGTNNELSDGTFYDAQFDAKVNGAVYSLGDLTLQGEGKIKIRGNYQDGVVSKDDLTFRSGEVEINAVDDAIRGKDSVHVAGAKIGAISGKDGLKATNSEFPDKGFVYIESGEVNVSAGDDGISAMNAIVVNGGRVDVRESTEGMEGRKIVINGGNISINARDDGMNASSSVDENGFTTNDDALELVINGGEIYVKSDGDALDSNGNLTINGGNVDLYARVEALDASGRLAIHGGEIVINGEKYSW